MPTKKKECYYELKINDVVIPYTLVKSSRRRTLSIQIGAGGNMTVRCPYFASKWTIDSMLKEKKDWIYNTYIESLNKNTKAPAPSNKPENSALVNKHKKYARKIFEARASYYSQFTGGTYTSISIRDQKTRWGSCSGRGTLSFNWRLILAPPEILDYVVVHELCHLTHMNHSKEFWKLVESVIPDYKIKRKWLKENGHTLHL